MKKLLRLLLASVDVSAMIVCFIAFAVLVGGSILIGIIEVVKQVGKELDSMWRDRVVAYVVLASLAWCAVRWKVLNRPGPHEPIFQGMWWKRLGGAALPGIFGRDGRMLCCIYCLIHKDRLSTRGFRGCHWRHILRRYFRVCIDSRISGIAWPIRRIDQVQQPCPCDAVHLSNSSPQF